MTMFGQEIKIKFLPVLTPKWQFSDPMYRGVPIKILHFCFLILQSYANDHLLAGGRVHKFQNKKESDMQQVTGQIGTIYLWINK